MIDAKAAGAIIGVSPRAMYQLAAKGKIRHYRPLPGKVVFAQEDVVAYRDAACRSAGTSATSAGALSSTATFKAAASGLLDCFRKAGVKPRLTPSTDSKPPGSTPLQLVSSSL